MHSRTLDESPTQSKDQKLLDSRVLEVSHLTTLLLLFLSAGLDSHVVENYLQHARYIVVASYHGICQTAFVSGKREGEREKRCLKKPTA